MLSARAYSFRQQCRLAISLSWVGGYVNVVALASCGSIVSHVSGTTTFLGRFLASGEFGRASFYAFLLATFFAGTLISAFLLEVARRRGRRSKYVMPIAAELALLAAFAVVYDARRLVDPTIEESWHLGLLALGSVAMGIQNATITRISGSVVRTTHLTGVVTDFALEGVQYLFWWRDMFRGRGMTRASRMLRVSQHHPTALRLLLLSSILGSFLVGVTSGALMIAKWPDFALSPVILFLGWIIAVDLRHPIADVRELDPLSDPELTTHGIVKELLPPQIGLYRASSAHGARSHRAPNFQLWVDRLPRHPRIVILAVHRAMKFDTNAVLDLEFALRKLHAKGRKLVLSGVTPVQFRALVDRSVERSMDFGNISPDLEIAIARAIALLHRMESQDLRAPRAADAPHPS